MTTDKLVYTYETTNIREKNKNKTEFVDGEYVNIRTRTRHIQYINKNGCHICTSHYKDKDGYPKTTINLGFKKNINILMHKLVYIDTYLDGDNTKLKPDEHIMHTCTNKDCINPEHLIIGKQKDHIPNCRGVKSNQSKLTEDDVLDIRKSDLTNLKLAKIYSVSDRSIGKIKNRETWTHI